MPEEDNTGPTGLNCNDEVALELRISSPIELQETMEVETESGLDLIYGLSIS